MIVRRPRIVALEERLEADRRAVRRLRRMEAARRSGVLSWSEFATGLVANGAADRAGRCRARRPMPSVLSPFRLRFEPARG